jgi:stage II sporulation protein E
MLQFGEIGVSAGITMLIPLKMIERLKQLSDVRFEAMGNRQGHTNRLKELMVNRLEAFSQVYHRLAEAFSRVSQYNVMTGKEDLNKLLDLAVNQVCINCGLYKTCWQRNFYSTYNNMFEIISIIESKGRADRECIPSAISENCLQMDTVLDILNEAYDLYRINYRWRQKIDECRNLVARQLEGISKLITGLACELDVDIKFNKELEDAILFELDRQGIRVREVTVAEKTDGKIEVNVTKKSCGRRMECSRHVERVIGDILRKPMSCNFKRCNSGGRECVLQFVEAERYKIMTGVARRIKQYADACGDNYSSIPLDDGKYMLALSDGMGSGSRADAESSMVVSLLENFLEAGFDLDMTVHTINSVLILRSRDEIFATADLCVVDLIRASADIVKIGAMSTFIKRKDRVDVIKSHALPMGILDKIQVETVKVILEDGDMIIMVTDGVLNSVDSELDQDEWFAGRIANYSTRNPQEMADFIMEEALKQTNGIANDDMTVMVSRIWKPSL